MINVDETVHDKMIEKYAMGDTPWTRHDLPPPEVQDMVGRLAAGRALDLGCGHGRASRYLAQHGWQVDGIDFVPQAIAEARDLADGAGLSLTINFWTGDITQLTMLAGLYDFALDVGCAHSLDKAGWQRHYAELMRLLRPGATYLHYGRLATAEKWGINDVPYQALMGNGFRLTAVTYGLTVMSPTDQWSSAWYEWQKKSEVEL